MAVDNRIERVTDPLDPQRCQGKSKMHGQCMNKALPGHTGCLYHGGAIQEKAQKAENLRNYRLGQLGPRLEELNQSGQLKSLREEIGLLRYLIEQKIIKTAGDDLQLMAQAPIIADLVMKVEKLVKSCNQIDTQIGQMLDKTQARNLALEFVEIANDYVTDPDDLNEMGDRLCAAVDRIAGNSG